MTSNELYLTTSEQQDSTKTFIDFFDTLIEQGLPQEFKVINTNEFPKWLAWHNAISDMLRIGIIINYSKMSEIHVNGKEVSFTATIE